MPAGDHDLPAVPRRHDRRDADGSGAILALGRIAHDSRADGARPDRRAAYPFGHGAVHELRPSADAFRQLPLLALQHEHRPADRGDVRRCRVAAASAAGRLRPQREPTASDCQRRQAALSPSPCRSRDFSRCQSRFFSVSRLSCELLAARQRDLDLGEAAIVEIDLERHDRHALALDRTGEPARSRFLCSSSLRGRRVSWLKRLACRYSGMWALIEPELAAFSAA